MNKRTIQIDVIGPIEETELMKCKLYVDGRVCVIGMSRYDYEELMREKVFIRDGKSVDSAGVINRLTLSLKMINIKLRMSIEQIIFNLLNKNAHTWVRYWQQKEMSGLTMPGEYIEIRTFFLSGIELSDFFAAGFKINKIQSQKIDADAYCDILLNKTD